MRTWTKTAGLLFLAASSVYGDWALSADVATQRGGAAQVVGNDIKVVDQTPEATAPAVDPFGAAQPVDAKPDKEGKSVTASQVNVSSMGTVEIHVNDASLVEVLRMLSLQSQRNIIASKDVRGTITANLYDVTIKEALDAILQANGFGYREKGNFIYVYSAKELAAIEASERHTDTEVFHLNYINAANASKLITPVLSKDGQLALTPQTDTGISSGYSKTGGDNHASGDVLVVTDYAENLKKVHELLKEIDAKPQQVLIEATILRASLSENNQLGIDLTVLGGVDFSTLNGSGTGSGSQTAGLLSGSIINTAGTGSITDAGAAAGSVGGSGLQVGLVTNNVSLFVKALESTTDTVVVANPKILVLNKQSGEVHVGADIGYRDQSTISEGGTSTVGQVSFLTTGTRLLFRPYISSDGYIRMEVHPEESSGSLDSDGLPTKNTSEVTSNVIVKDGNTIVIGGLFREQTVSGRSQTPGLGNMPFVGPLFRKTTDSTQRDEVIVLLTPHIVKDDAAYAAASAEELKAAEQIRVGVRKGMMPWGRERLAESEYEAAQAELRKPEPDVKKALWHLDSATNLYPTFSEAIQLKESLTGRVITDVDSSTIRSFVTRQILMEQAPAATSPAGNATPATTEPPTPLIHTASVAPATQPVEVTTPKVAAAEAPSTQPVAETESPAVDSATTQAPVEVSPVVEPATTEPAAPATVEAPTADNTVEPATQAENSSGFTGLTVRVLEQFVGQADATVSESSATQPAVAQAQVNQSEVNVPSTQPVVSPSGSTTGVTVTELPSDWSVEPKTSANDSK